MTTYPAGYPTCFHGEHSGRCWLCERATRDRYEKALRHIAAVTKGSRPGSLEHSINDTAEEALAAAQEGDTNAL